MATSAHDDATRDEVHDEALAPGGWRRAVIGMLVGLAAGALVALITPRDPPRETPDRHAPRR